MDKEQRDFLLRRREEALKEQPSFSKLIEKLLSYGGDIVVSRYEEDLEDLLKRGKIIDFPVKLKLGERNNCHSNAASLYEIDNSYKIVIGWALSDDRLWRQHSWALKNNEIIETTEKRDTYFGFILEEWEAENFCFINV